MYTFVSIPTSICICIYLYLLSKLCLPKYTHLKWNEREITKIICIYLNKNVIRRRNFQLTKRTIVDERSGGRKLPKHLPRKTSTSHWLYWWITELVKRSVSLSSDEERSWSSVSRCNLAKKPYILKQSMEKGMRGAASHCCSFESLRIYAVYAVYDSKITCAVFEYSYFFSI